MLEFFQKNNSTFSLKALRDMLSKKVALKASANPLNFKKKFRRNFKKKLNLLPSISSTVPKIKKEKKKIKKKGIKFFKKKKTPNKIKLIKLFRGLKKKKTRTMRLFRGPKKFSKRIFNKMKKKEKKENRKPSFFLKRLRFVQLIPMQIKQKRATNKKRFLKSNLLKRIKKKSAFEFKALAVRNILLYDFSISRLKIREKEKKIKMKKFQKREKKVVKNMYFKAYKNLSRFKKTFAQERIKDAKAFRIILKNK